MSARRIRGAWWVVALVTAGAVAWWWLGGGIANPGKPGAAPPAPAASASAPKAPTVFELAASETLVASRQTLAQTLAVSGSIKAVKTAVVKVRVAGEITQLSLREGDAVKAGQVVARIDPTEVNARLRQANDQADAARAQVDIAQRAFDNNQSLVQQGFISKTALDNAAATLAGAKASHQAAKAAVDLAQRSLDDTVLRAPISGVVSAKGVQNGERAGVEARVIDIVSLADLELEAVVPPQDAAAVKVGQTATLTVEGLTDQIVQAKVVRTNPNVQVGSRGVVVYLAVTPVPALKNGLFAQGQLTLGSVSVLALPVSVVRIDKPSPYVQAVVAGKVVHQPVTLGPRGMVAGQSYVALTGVAEGAVLLSGTVGQLREGTPVKVMLATASAVSAPAPSLPSASASAAVGQ